MNITYIDENRTFKLDTDNTSYIISIVDDEGFLGHVYYGAYVEDVDLSYLLRTGEAPFTPSVNDRDRSSFLDSFPTEYSGNGVGDYRDSSIAVTDAEGHHAIQLLYKGYRIYNGKPALPGLPATFAGEDEAMTLEIDVEDKSLGVDATLFYSVFKSSDAISRSICFRNESDKEIYLDKIMSVCIDMDDNDYSMMILHGAWARERNIEKRSIGYGRQSINSVRGESSHQENPFFALVSENITQTTGEVYGFNFVYSGNFIGQVEKSQFDSLRVLMGIHPDGFRFKLGRGEDFFAPEVVMVYSGNGLGVMTRTYHDLYRKHLIRSAYLDKPRPVLINNWEATYFDFNEEKLLSIARDAKAAGIEMLVMDDGWFGNRNDDNSSLGDWYVNEDKLKGGLKKLVDNVNEIGLKFGIWFEPEMISPDSDLYREHPDWAFAINGRRPCRGRNQFVLDITRREVLEYVYESVARILRSANIEYVKWDMNRQLSDVGSIALDADRQGELLHRYVLSVYELQERLIREFPDLLLENCSGGGARFDPGMLYYSPQIWCSDDTDAIERLAIQEGTALVYPLSTMGAHVSDCPNHTVGRVTPFKTRGHVALVGTFGYELDITKIPEEDRKAIPGQIADYHKYNELVRNGDYYRIASYSENGVYDFFGVVSKDKTKALFTYVQVHNRPNCHGIKVKLQGLADDKKYRISETETVLFGKTLKNAGIILDKMWGDYQSKLIYLEEA